MDEWLDPEAIGARLKLARKLARGSPSQRQMARRLKVSLGAWSNYERGVRVPWDHLNEIAKVTGRTPEWILFGSDPVDGAVLQEGLARIEETLGRILGRLQSRERGEG